MVMFWVLLLAISILLYVLLDGADLGIGMLFGLTRGEAEHRVMLKAISPIWDGNETWLVATGVILWGAFPVPTRPSCRPSIFPCFSYWQV
jgi:cytochrome d ubiquinol oxidase subunit II